MAGFWLVLGDTLLPSNQIWFGCGMLQAWSRDCSKCTEWTRQPYFGIFVGLDIDALTGGLCHFSYFT